MVTLNKTVLKNGLDKTRKLVAQGCHLTFILPVLLAAGISAGCNMLGIRETENEMRMELERKDVDLQAEEVKNLLKADLKLFEENVEQSFEDALQALARQDPDEETRENYINWQKAQSERFKSTLDQEEPIVALLDTWALAESTVAFLVENEAAAGLGDDAYRIALNMSKIRRSYIESLAFTYLPPEIYREMNELIENFTESRDLTEETFLPLEVDTKEYFSLWSIGQDALTRLIRLPLMPARVAGSVVEGGVAVADLRTTAARATMVVEQLPQRIREELETLLHTLVEQQEEIMQMLEQSEAITANTMTTSKHAEATARHVEQSLQTAQDAIPAASELMQSFNAAINASSDLTSDITELITLLDKMQEDKQAGLEGDNNDRGFEIEDYRLTAKAVEEGAIEVRQLLAEVRKLTEPAEPDINGEEKNDKRPFDILDYRDTANEIRTGAQEIQNLIAQLHSLMADEELAAALDAAGRHVQTSTNELAARTEQTADHITWRIIQIVGIFFIFLTGYSWLRLRVLPKAPGD